MRASSVAGPWSTSPLGDVRRSALRSVRTFVPPLVGGLVVAMLASEVRAGRADAWVLLEAVVGCGGAALLFVRRRLTTGTARDAAADVLWIGAVALLTVLHYGPTAGVAAGWLGMGLLARFFMGARAGMALITAVLAVHVGAAWALAGGTLSPPDPATHAFGDPAVWIRIGIVLALVLFALDLVFGRLVAAYEQALIREADTRRWHQEALEARRVAEAERTRAIVAAEAAQHMETVGRMAGGVAHDVNNALTVIQGNLELLDEEPDPRERALLLREVRLAAAGATRTSSELLAVAHGTLDFTGTSSARAVLEGLLSALRRLLPVDVALEVGVEGTADARVDAAGLRRSVLNLVFNARDAVGPGGVIHVTLSDGESPAGPELVLEVRDDGPGMDAGTLARSRDPFFTTRDPAVHGGLGLSMVDEFAVQSGGRLALESSPGRGTAARLHLPAAAAAEEAGSRTPNRGAGLAGLRVLCADDEPPLRRLLQRHLERAGASVTMCDAAPALQDAIAREAPFDALVTDAVMPGGGTAEAIEAFRRSAPGAPVLVVSGHVREELVLRGIEQGATHFLAKPFTGEQLVSLLVSLLGPARAGVTRP